ncbi:hypothetical protein BDF19DRAFT_444269 [Syncephalis fuscata]|nr:hypothetical protein BDF19DRAFT_444269 [Syncephalis fuscata]
MTTNNRNTNKAKQLIDVSATTVLDLKAEIFRATDQFEREKRSSATKGYVPAKKHQKKAKTVWTSQNRGVSERNARDAQATSEDAINLENSRKALERKAQLYKQLQQGKLEDSSQSTSDTLLVDFDKKRWDYSEQTGDSDDSSDDQRDNDPIEDRSESITSRKRQNDHLEIKDEGRATYSNSPDAWVDYTDEFGRTRTIRQRDMPKSLLANNNNEAASNADMPELMSADMRREQERQRWEEEARADSKDLHYNANKEIRTKGVGYYQFAQSEEERAKQLQKLNEIRAETEQKRASHQNIRDKRREQLALRAEQLRQKRARYEEKDDKTISIDKDTAQAISNLITSLRPSSHNNDDLS